MLSELSNRTENFISLASLDCTISMILSSGDDTPTPRKTVRRKQFRFQAQRVLLTYAQCGNLTREDVLFTLQERYVVDLHCCAEELHSDGGRHIHCLLHFKKKLNVYGQDIFDINDGENVHHPNIAPVKRGAAHWEQAHEYCEKEDPCPLCNIKKKLTWSELLEEAKDGIHYMDLVRANYPRDYQLNYQRFQHFVKEHWGTCLNTIKEGWTPNYDHSVPGPLSLLEEDLTAAFNKTLVIVGEPGCGKTTWAKEHAPKPALFVRHLDSLARFRPEHRSIIFDDLDFRHLPESTQKYLVDYENVAEIHIRYNVARIPEGISRIITANEYPFTDNGVHARAIDRRVNKIFL